MRLSGLLLVASQLLAAATQQWPLHNDGLNDVVQWDHYSLLVNGERLFFWSGEFHYWRIPVPELWIDIMQKIKVSRFQCPKMYHVLTAIVSGGRLQRFLHLLALGLAQCRRRQA